MCEHGNKTGGLYYKNLMMEVISAEVLACRLAETRRHMLNSADDLRDGAFVTYRAFCPALCYGHVLPWEHAALSKSPGFKASQPDWGLGQCQGIKNSQTSSTKTPLTPSLPSTVPLLLLFYILLALSLGQSVCVVLIPRSVTAELHAASFCVVSLTPLYLFITKASRISSYTFQPS